jgi:tetrahydromethanopterin S-methyltransferase subunit H
MIRFNKEQAIVEIAGNIIGGQPGEYATTLMGAIFYAGDNLVASTNSAEFNIEKATTIIHNAQKMCKEVGINLILDIICATPEQAKAFIGFALDTCDLPILMDGTTFEVKMAGLKTAQERDAQDRIIYNAIQPSIKDNELLQVSSMGFKNAIVMLVNQRDPTVKGKISIAQELIPRALDSGFENLLIDLAVLDIIDVGTCSVAIREIKEEFGLPCGCSPTHTHRNRWKKAQHFSPKAQAAAKAATATMIQCAGGDFFIYDIKQTEIIPAMAMVDAEIAYGAMSWKTRPKLKSHPLYNIFQ